MWNLTIGSIWGLSCLWHFKAITIFTVLFVDIISTTITTIKIIFNIIALIITIVITNIRSRTFNWTFSWTFSWFFSWAFSWNIVKTFTNIAVLFIHIISTTITTIKIIFLTVAFIIAIVITNIRGRTFSWTLSCCRAWWWWWSITPHVSLNPVQNSSCSCIDSRIVRESTSNAKTNNTSQYSFAIVSANKWTTRITLTRIFSSFGESSTDHGISDSIVSLVTLFIGHSWYSNPLKSRR